MSATIIDGRKIADQILAEAAEKIRQAKTPPGLAVLLVGDNPASQVYVRNKVRACEKVGVVSARHDMPDDASEAAVLDKIAELNAAPDIHGILVQLPLPKHIDAGKVLETINPEKDVDGFHAVHMGKLAADMPSLRPCTPAGCMRLLSETRAQFRGAHAVVLGRSHIVGKPMALLLINAGATVTVCNSATPDLPSFTRAADILVAAAGVPHIVTGGMVKPGAAVIDVGINRLPDGKITGDVDFDAAAKVAGAITPVPGGVGPMTIAQLISNTLQAAGL